MDSIDLEHLKSRGRTAYELGRMRRALLGVAPLVLIVTIAAYVARHPVSTLGFGLAAVVMGASLLWYGRDVRKAVLPGVAAGLVPLVLALCATTMHVCGPEACVSLCIPACALGGVVAGLAVAGVGNQRRSGAGFWLAASALALFTGAAGCTCVGYAGLVGLGLGFAAGLVPSTLRRFLRPNAP